MYVWGKGGAKNHLFAGAGGAKIICVRGQGEQKSFVRGGNGEHASKAYDGGRSSSLRETTTGFRFVCLKSTPGVSDEDKLFTTF